MVQVTQNGFKDILAYCQGNEKGQLIPVLVKTIAGCGNQHFIYDLIQHCPQIATPENMRIFEQGIIDLAQAKNNPTIAYEFMFEMATDFKIQNFDLERFEKLIIDYQNPKLMDYCIRCIKGTNVPRMLSALYATGSLKYIARVKQKYEEHNVNQELYPAEQVFNEEYDQALASARENAYTPFWIDEDQFTSPTLEELCARVVAAKKPYLINELADYFEYLLDYNEPDEQFRLMLEALIEILKRAMKKQGEMLDKYEFSWSVKRADVPSMQEDVIASGDVKFMTYFIDIPGSDPEILTEAIRKINPGFGAGPDAGQGHGLS